VQNEIVSKTRKKREMHELQALGVALSSSPKHNEINGARGRSAGGRARGEAHQATTARRRQMQYIVRLMRDIDPAAIRSPWAVEGSSAQASAAPPPPRNLAGRLLADDEGAHRLRRRASRRPTFRHCAH